MIITLILLGVVTFMAIAFLALSRRERGAVATVTDTTSARLAADAALANAEGQIVANALAATNPFNFGLLVSTNYINPNGFQTGIANPTNVNYTYPGGAPVAGNDFLQLLANLYYSPRPPVFIPNPTNSSLPPDFRYYLDLNRNGRYDTNGWVTNLDNNLQGLGTAGIQVGDPEWIGVLQRPDQPYGPNNPFVARYAFIALPVGNSLDLNAIYNQAMTRSVNPASGGADGFLRNQGVGSWEINLAAFLTDLNTNQWDPAVDSYNYREWMTPNFANQGRGFEDALSLLSYRYATNYNSLSPVGGTTPNGLFTTANSFPPFQNNIDAYSYGPLMTTPAGINVGPTVSWPWVGADNTNHLFTPSELFNPNEISPLFVNSLLAAGNNNSTYDRYTFYRMLSQLGTDTTPESGRMNLNYDNLTPTNGVASSTNFMAWTPLAFFTNAADRLLRAYTTEWRNGNPTNFAASFYSVANFNFINADQWTNYPAFGINHIPVLVSNRFVYSSAVNRLLQLAANMYDAATDNLGGINGNTFNYPSVFRPLFTRDAGGNIFVTGYTNVGTVSGAGDISVPFDASTISALVGVSNVSPNVNIYGVPWIIGAKKGFPNFNKFSMQNVVQITRKLQIARSKAPISSVSDLLYTNQLFVFSISNSIGMDCWNSYSNLFPNPVQIVVQDNLSMILTNDGGAPSVGPSGPLSYSINTNLPVTPSWPGSAWDPGTGLPAANSFTNPINTTIQFLTNSVFYSGTTPPGVQGFYPEGDNLGWETNKHDFAFPNFGLLTTNRLQVFMLCRGHVIDYAQFAGPESSRNLNAEIQTNVQASGYGYLWSTNLNKNKVPWGIISQIDASDGRVQWNGEYWNNGSAPDEISGFSQFMGFGTANGSSTAQYYATNYIVQVPYTPTVTACEYISWQANDPLVHYLASDLNFQGTEANGGPTTGINVWTKTTPLPRPSFNQVNDRYMPWGGNPNFNAPPGDTSWQTLSRYNTAIKDPLVSSSDFWDFPTNKFPTVGWLGRVHRGTPWQTVYLKASDILPELDSFGSNIGTNIWVTWTGDQNLFDATNAAPAQDRLLFDLFTTAINDNATRGTLSVNQSAGSSDPGSGLAAWSAMFSGIAVPTSLTNSYAIISPAGTLGAGSILWPLVTNINTVRANFTNADGLVGTFEHVGDILAAPALTEQSPFLTGLDPNAQISDELYEWLPQQTMSLLRVSDSPRYVIYCYGQALKPAPGSVISSSSKLPSGLNPLGMVTNYQIVSEIATRAVVRFNSSVTNAITTNYDGLGNLVWYTVPVVTNNNAVIESFNILPPD